MLHLDLHLVQRHVSCGVRVWLCSLLWEEDSVSIEAAAALSPKEYWLIGTSYLGSP